MTDKVLVFDGSYRADRLGIRLANGGEAQQKAFPRFADDLAWWTDAARRQRAVMPPPY